VSPILLHVESGIARITLNRPDRLNAFDADMALAWADITAEVTARADVGVILLDGAGRSFCAGGDVMEMASAGYDGSRIEEFAGVINRGIRSLIESAVPVVAAAHGTTAGGGLGIMLASDYVVVGTDSQLGSLYANMALTPDLSVTAQLASAVGERRALQLVLTDRLLSAQEALEWGLVAEAVDPTEVGARAEAIARSWIDGATRAYGEAKRLIRSRPSRDLAGQLAEEARTIGAALDSADAQTRVAAFAARSRSKER